MPIPPELWKAETKAALERISDETCQRLAWFNGQKEISSPDELINQLLDDFSFESFIEDEGIGLSDAQKTAARLFYAKLAAFCEAAPSKLDPGKIIDDLILDGQKYAMRQRNS